MTEFFAYETLTWPEVAALPRHTPLVIPLGQGYPLETVAEALGHPPRIGLLPPIPFGWPGSGLAEIHEQQQRREARRNSGFGLWGYRT